MLTDGKVLVLDNGLQARLMSIRDGYALQLAASRGYRISIVSGADSMPVTQRLNKLGITDVYMSVRDKAGFIRDYCSERSITRKQVLFMGDDMPDLPVAGIAGLFCCPADAIDEIRAASDYVSPVDGGHGCVRDVIEKVLKARGHWTGDPHVTSS